MWLNSILEGAPKTALVIAPHPDDEVIGCGGTIHRLSRLGWSSAIAVINSQSQERAKEAQESSRILGAERCELLFSEPDGLSINSRFLVRRIELLMEEINPQLVLVPSGYSAHQEHRLVASCATAALRPNAGSGRFRPSVVLQYEEIADSWPPSVAVSPSVFVEITESDMDAKVRALEAHSSQLREFPSERSSRAVRSLAETRGSLAGRPMVEAFVPLICVL